MSENISSIMMNSLSIKKRDPRTPMITSEIGGMTFTRSLLDTEASINILPKAVYDRHHVGELQPFLIELCLAETSWHSRRCDCLNRRMLFSGRLPSCRYEDH